MVSTEEDETLRGPLTVSRDLKVPTGRTGACYWPPGERAGCCPAPTMPGTPPPQRTPSPNVHGIHTETPLAPGSKCINWFDLRYRSSGPMSFSLSPPHRCEREGAGAKRTAQGHPRTWRQDAKPGVWDAEGPTSSPVTDRLSADAP